MTFKLHFIFIKIELILILHKSNKLSVNLVVYILLRKKNCYALYAY